jgi:myo-inositol 2-dehydrogenase/D-chiro-inositol 1-dehydrogenase
MTIHDFDTARFFLGDVTSVTATGQHLDRPRRQRRLRRP